MRDDFVVFIITHKRPDNQITYKTSTEQYREVNLYWNYFYPVLYVPSAISVAYGKTGFIKRVRWNNLLPQIINEKWRKGYEK